MSAFSAMAQGAWESATVTFQEWGGGNSSVDAVVTTNADGSHTVSAKKSPNIKNGVALDNLRRSRLLFNGLPVNVVSVNGILDAGSNNPATGVAYNDTSADACTLIAGTQGWVRNELGDGIFTYEYTITENPTHYLFMEGGGAKLGCDLLIDTSLEACDMNEIFFSITFDKDDRFVSATVSSRFYNPENVSEWVKMTPIIRQWGPNNRDSNNPAVVESDGNGGHIFTGIKTPNGGISNLGLDGVGCARVLIPNLPANVFVVNQFAAPDSRHPLGGNRKEQPVTIIGTTGWVKNGDTYTLTLVGDDQIFYHFYAEGNNTITDDLYLSPALAGSVIKDYRYTLYFDSTDKLTKAVIDVNFSDIVVDDGIDVDPDNVNTGTYNGKLLWAKMNEGSVLTARNVAKAFDNDPATTVTFGAQAGYQWIGVDLGEAKPVSHLSYTVGEGTDWTYVRLGVFQGANDPGFADAVPLYMITDEAAPEGGKVTVRLDCPGRYRYLRYVGPGHGTGDAANTYCRIADISFIYDEGVAVPEIQQGVNYNLYRPTNLPLVIVNTQGEKYFDGNFGNKSPENTFTGSTVIVVDGSGMVNLVDTVTEIRGRGNSSWNISQKRPFRIKLSKSASLLDAPAKGKKWTMINNWGDKTLMRNILGFEMGRRIGMDYVPYAQAVDLIFNGQYMGCYQLCDQIDVRKGRVNVTEIDRADPTVDFGNIDGGFLVEVDAYAYQEAAHECFIAKAADGARNYSIPVTIKSPDMLEDMDNDPVRHTMIESFEKMLNSVYSYGYQQDHPTPGPARSQNILEPGDPEYYFLFYVKDFLKYLIVEDYIGNPDAFWSTYMYKEKGDPQWHVGPMWDLDIAFGNNRYLNVPAGEGGDATDSAADRGQKTVFFPFEAEDDYSNYKGSFAGNIPANADWGQPAGSQYENGLNAMERFVNIIINDPQSKQQLKELWSDGQNRSGLTKDDLNDYIDAKAKELQQSANLNFARWPILAATVHNNYNNQPTTYEKHVDQLKDYIAQKHDVLQSNYGYDPNYDTTGIENVVSAIGSAVSINVVAGGIKVTGASSCSVYGADGRLAYTGPTSSTVILRPGFYIVDAAGVTAKVLVK